MLLILRAYLTPFRALCTMLKSHKNNDHVGERDILVTILCNSVDRTFFSVGTEGKSFIGVQEN